MQVLTEESNLRNIAEAIRNKRGTSNMMSPAEMAPEIEKIKTGQEDPWDPIQYAKEYRKEKGYPDIPSCRQIPEEWCTYMTFDLKNTKELKFSIGFRVEDKYRGQISELEGWNCKKVAFKVLKYNNDTLYKEENICYYMGYELKDNRWTKNYNHKYENYLSIGDSNSNYDMTIASSNINSIAYDKDYNVKYNFIVLKIENCTVQNFSWSKNITDLSYKVLMLPYDSYGNTGDKISMYYKPEIFSFEFSPLDEEYREKVEGNNQKYIKLSRFNLVILQEFNNVTLSAEDLPELRRIPKKLTFKDVGSDSYYFFYSCPKIEHLYDYDFNYFEAKNAYFGSESSPNLTIENLTIKTRVLYNFFNINNLGIENTVTEVYNREEKKWDYIDDDIYLKLSGSKYNCGFCSVKNLYINGRLYYIYPISKKIDIESDSGYGFAFIENISFGPKGKIVSSQALHHLFSMQKRLKTFPSNIIDYFSEENISDTYEWFYNTRNIETEYIDLKNKKLGTSYYTFANTGLKEIRNLNLEGCTIAPYFLSNGPKKITPYPTFDFKGNGNLECSFYNSIDIDFDKFIFSENKYNFDQTFAHCKIISNRDDRNVVFNAGVEPNFSYTFLNSSFDNINNFTINCTNGTRLGEYKIDNVQYRPIGLEAYEGNCKSLSLMLNSSEPLKMYNAQIGIKNVLLDRLSFENTRDSMYMFNTYYMKNLIILDIDENNYMIDSNWSSSSYKADNVYVPDDKYDLINNNWNKYYITNLKKLSEIPDDLRQLFPQLQ